MEKNLVSIITPVYNGADFLHRSIKSVLAQTYQHWELILIDDSSDDNSVEVIKKYETDDRIKLLKNDSNRGIPATRNNGIRQSKGEYVALLDQDDEWTPDKIETQIKILGKSDDTVGLCYSNVKFQSEERVLFEQRNEIEAPDSIDKNFELMLFKNLITSSTALIKKVVLDEIGLFDESILWGGDDYDLWLRIAQKYKFAYADKTLCIRFEHDKNYSGDKKKMMMMSIEMGESYAKEYNLDNSIIKAVRANHYYRYGIESIKKKNIGEGMYHIIKSLIASKRGFKEMLKTFRNRFRAS